MFLVSFNGCDLGGNYGPASMQSGTGLAAWTKAPLLRATAEEVKETLYANPPDWLRQRQQMPLQALRNYLQQYGVASSRFTKFDALAQWIETRPQPCRAIPRSLMKSI